MNDNDIWEYSYKTLITESYNAVINIDDIDDIDETIVYINNDNYLEYFTKTGNINSNIKEVRLNESICIDKNIFIKLNNDVIFNGQGNIIKIDNNEFLGLFYINGGSIMNLNIEKGSSKLVKGSGIGWLLRSNCNGKLINCSCITNAPNNVAYYSAERGSKLTNMTYLDRIDYLVIK